MTVELDVNGGKHTIDADDATPLLFVLRNDLGLNGPRFGCGLGQCGACTVLANGAPIRSCVVPISAASGLQITTLEGLGSRENPHPLQQAFLDEQAAQCGYCSNGMIVGSAALLARTPQPTDAEIREALQGYLCRCGTHTRILRAVRRAAEAGR
jgi:nicotinate dehydrogenase subunit A